MSFWDDDEPQAKPGGFWDDDEPAAAPAAQDLPAARAEQIKLTRGEDGDLSRIGAAELEKRGSAPAWVSALAGAFHGATSGLTNMVPGGRAFNEWAQKSNDGSFGVGDFGGSIANPTNFIPGGLATRAAIAGVQGATRSASDTDGGALEALKQGGQDAGLAAALDVALGGAGKAVGALSRAAKESGLRARVAATGHYGSSLRNLQKQKGSDYITKLGQEIEDRGLHRGDGPLGFLPQPVETYADNAERLLKDAGQRMGASEDAISQLANPPSVPLENAAAKLEQSALDNGSMWDPAGRGASDFQGQLAANMRNVGTQGGDIGMEAGAPAMAEWNSAIKNRRFIDSQINYGRAAGYEGAPMQEAVRRELRGDLATGIKDSLDQGVSDGNVPAELRDQWRGGNDDYRVGQDVFQPASNRVAREEGNQLLSLPTLIAGTAGAAAGGVAGYQNGGGWSGGLAGAAGGALLRSRGKSAVAGALGNVAGAGAMTATALQGLRSVAPGAVSWMNGSNGPQTSARDQSATNATSAGYALGSKVSQLMNSPQGSVLSPWAAEFANAEDDDRRSAIAERLARVDPRFNAQVMPLLAAGR